MKYSNHRSQQKVSHCCYSRPYRYCRQTWCRSGLTLLLGSMILSSLIPNAPLARWLLWEDTERHRLLMEKEMLLKRSKQTLEEYRTHLRQQWGVLKRDGSFPATVGIAMLTMSRERTLSKKQRYRTESLTESLGALLGLLNDTSLKRTYSFHLCNVDPQPELFQEAEELQDVLPVFKRFQSGTFPNSGRDQNVSTWEKLKMDYVYCLQQMVSLGVRYVLVVEDDAVAHKDLFPVLERVLEEVVEAPESRPVAYIKLYHPLRLLGFLSLEVERLPELLSLSLILGALLTCWRAGFWKIHYSDLFAISRSNLWRRWACWSVVVAVLALSVGRINFLELRRLSPHLYMVTPTPSCCTPAILYTHQGAQDLSNYLLKVTCTEMLSTDMHMDDFRQKRAENRALLIQPNLFTHIGLVSGLNRREINPLAVD